MTPGRAGLLLHRMKENKTTLNPRYETMIESHHVFKAVIVVEALWCDEVNYICGTNSDSSDLTFDFCC